MIAEDESVCLTARVVQTFLKHGKGAIEALEQMRVQLEEDLRSLLIYYGEDPRTAKIETLFTTLLAFSSSLEVGGTLSPDQRRHPLI